MWGRHTATLPDDNMKTTTSEVGKNFKAMTSALSEDRNKTWAGNEMFASNSRV